MIRMCIYDFYLRGYWDGVRFSYLPDFENDDQQDAYWQGYRDAKNKRGKTDIEDFILHKPERREMTEDVKKEMNDYIKRKFCNGEENEQHV